ncbi:hypothetical protein Tco_0630234 [Tanacetum coccineum]
MKMEILLETNINSILVGEIENPDGSDRLASGHVNSTNPMSHLKMKKVLGNASSEVTTLHGGNTTTRMIKRFTVADDLKESSKITQVKGTEFKDHYFMYKEINA